MKKIAFLFLTIDDINFPKLWDNYFKDNEDKYSIYIHPKYPEKTTWHKENIIKNLKETGWGFITRAYTELLKEAIQDKDNYKFITVSEACVPIQSFNKFYNDVINDDKSWIKLMDITKYKRDVVLKGIKGNIIHHYARWCLNRDHVKQILIDRTKLEQFHNMHIGDEYFLSVLYPLKNYKNFPVTFDDWEYTENLKKKMKNQIKDLYDEQESDTSIDNNEKIKEIRKKLEYESGHPKVIVNVEEDLDKIKNCSSYFYRKFPKNSNIDKYWKEIINYHENNELIEYKTNLKFKPTIDCVFVHIPKTAGITLYESIFELDRSFGWFLGSDEHKGSDIKLEKMKKSGGVMLGHIYYKSLLEKDYLDKTFFNNSFKFCFVRNPFARLVSLYKYHQVKNRLKLEFDDFVKLLYQEWKDNKIPPIGLYNIKPFNKSSKLYHKDIYGNQYNQMIDWIPNNIGFIGRLEYFDEDVNKLLNILGYTGKINIPKLNTTKEVDYKEYYKNKDTINKTLEIYKDDINRFGYRL